MYHTCIIYQVSGDGEGVILRGNTIKNTGNRGASVMDGTRHSVEGKTMGVEYMYAYVCVCVPYVPHSYYLRFPPSPSLPLPHLSSGNTIHHTGGSGVDMEGGDKDSLTPAHHTVTGNTIHHWERVCLTYNPGVKVDGVGNTVSNNLLYVKHSHSFIHS